MKDETRRLENKPDDYESCGTCNFDHSYEESQEFHMNEIKDWMKKELKNPLSNYANEYDLSWFVCVHFQLFKNQEIPEFIIEMSKEIFNNV